MDRITFKGGWWADVRTEWSYGADARVAAAQLFQRDDAESFENAQRVLLVESVEAAHIPDLEGNAVAFGPEMWGSVNGRIGRAILKKCRANWAAWQKDADPNDTGRQSPA